MGDFFNPVLLAGPGPVVHKIVDVHFEVLQIILFHVLDVVLQLVQRGQLHVRHDAPVLVEAPQDAGHQTDHMREQ